jgi:hypothetical protein
VVVVLLFVNLSFVVLLRQKFLNYTPVNRSTGNKKKPQIPKTKLAAAMNICLVYA